MYWVHSTRAGMGEASPTNFLPNEFLVYEEYS